MTNLFKTIKDIQDNQEDTNNILNKLIVLNNEMGKLSCVENIDVEGLEMIGEILKLSREIHCNLTDKLYTSGNNISNDLKDALDDLKEYNQDLNDLFFVFPNDPEMKLLADQLYEAFKKL